MCQFNNTTSCHTIYSQRVSITQTDRKRDQKSCWRSRFPRFTNCVSSLLISCGARILYSREKFVKTEFLNRKIPSGGHLFTFQRIKSKDPSLSWTSSPFFQEALSVLSLFQSLSLSRSQKTQVTIPLLLEVETLHLLWDDFQSCWLHHLSSCFLSNHHLKNQTFHPLILSEENQTFHPLILSEEKVPSSNGMIRFKKEINKYYPSSYHPFQELPLSSLTGFDLFNWTLSFRLFSLYL